MLITACSTLPRPSPNSDFEKEFGVQEVAPDTFVITDRFFYDSNILVAKMPDGSVFVASSPYETKGAEALIGWIKGKWNPSKIIAVNTHFHPDGTGGNEAFKRAGAEIWSSDLTRKLLNENPSSAQAAQAEAFASRPELKERILRRKKVLAERTFPLEKGKEFDLGGEEVKVMFVGGGHSRDNTPVYLPRRKVLFGTCMVRPLAMGIGPLKDADVKSWPRAIQKLQTLEARVIVPGHGKLGGPELLDHTLKLAQKEARR
jgi:glyoxylase-like metal-dependent hydrolase (beta-lactamase superfamily II)